MDPLFPPYQSDPPQLLDTQLDFFHKLGYSTAQVQAVQKKFGPNTDTDKVLGELVRVRADPEAQQGLVMSSADPPATGVTLQLSHSKDDGGEEDESLRPIVIDGSNVAMSHGNKEFFSCLGIQLAVNFFLERGHTDVTAFVPSWRKEQPRPDVPITDQHILRDMEKRKHLVFTPSRRVAGKRVVCNDDVFIVQLAYESDGVIVSNDMYRDLQGERPEWKRFIDERLLMYSFVNDKFMPPHDPLGRHGPTLENFLRKFPKTPKKMLCPYGKKCTYGIKCKFLHPERAKQSNRLLADAHQGNKSGTGPVPDQNLLQVEEMAKKMTLGHESGSLKKDHKKESVAQVKASARTSNRSTSKKEKKRPGSPPGSTWHRGSQEQLDSGLGSIGSQPTDAPWTSCEHQHGAAGGSGQPSHRTQEFYPPAHGAHSTGELWHPHSGNWSMGSHGPDMTLYGTHHHRHGDRVPPLTMPAYREAAIFQHRGHEHQQYWSDPLALHPSAGHRLPDEHWWPPPPPAAPSNPSAQEREVVRKKLCAIFSAPLVQKAMDMFPQLMDPQMLAAEIITLQSQNKVR